MVEINIFKPKVLYWLFALAGMFILFYFMPLFHLVSLEGARQKTALASFNPENVVDEYWQTLQNRDKAVDINSFVSVFLEGPEIAAKRYGNKLGLGANTFYYIAGTGKIASVNSDLITIVLSEESNTGNNVKINIEIGPVFSNAIRDGSGLFNISDFSSSQDFNALSSVINRRVEEQVFPLLQNRAEPGAVVGFVGGVEIIDPDDPTLFTLVPAFIEFL